MKDMDQEDSAIRKDGYTDRPVIVYDPDHTWHYNDNVLAMLRLTFSNPGHNSLDGHRDQKAIDAFMKNEVRKDHGDDGRGVCLIPERYRTDPEDFARLMFHLYEAFNAVNWPNTMTFLTADFHLRRDANAFAPNILKDFARHTKKTVPDEVNLLTISQRVQEAFSFRDSPKLPDIEMSWVNATYREIQLFLNPREVSSWTERGSSTDMNK